MNNNFYSVIMAGGIGTRFWPVSTTIRPKQFLEIGKTGKTFIQGTFDRMSRIVPKENILVVTGERFGHIVSEQLPDIKKENILLEPYNRDTAPCITYATYTLLKRNPDAVVVVTPSDHFIPDEEIFVEDVTKALEYTVGKDILMTLGVPPTRPDPNYGYIQVSGGRYRIESNAAVKVKTFTEKPDIDLARAFLNTGEFLWNSGVFVWNVKTVKEELEQHLHSVTSLFSGWENAIGSIFEHEFIEKVYTDCIKISIDYGVMEKTDKAWLYPGHFRWADIGNWESLYDIMPEKDKDGNGFDCGRLLSSDNKDCLIVGRDKHKLLMVKGLENYMVIDTDDVLLICPKNDRKFKDFTAGIAMPGFEDYR